MADQYAYRTIDQPGRSDYREKGSKHFGYAFHIESDLAFKEALQQIRKEHHQAGHHCYAYVLGEKGEVYRSSDDGEPGGTAGNPILAPLQGKELTYSAVVVVRYFGGTKLGKGGLVRAYGTASKEALEQSQIKTVELTQLLRITCSINTGEKLKGEILNLGGSIEHSSYSTQVTIKANYPKRLLQNFLEQSIENRIQVELIEAKA